MKNLFTFALSAIILFMSACTKDNTCVKQIAEIISAGAEQYQKVDNGELAIEDISEEDLFTTPDGNIFDNPKIYEIIKANKDYKLTEEDKQILKKEVSKFKREGKGIDAVIETATFNTADDAIDRAKTLRDLWYNGSTF